MPPRLSLSKEGRNERPPDPARSWFDKLTAKFAIIQGDLPIARMPYLDLKDLPPEHHDLLARRANIYRALAHSPNGLRAFSTLGGFIRFKS
jgi:hypothetical protein